MLIEQERDKYRRMWGRPEYQVISPGREHAPAAFIALGAVKGQSLRDYGCGMGTAVDYFRLSGLEAEGVDLVPYRDGIKEMCLWDMPEMEQTDYAFCCDVMEHIPPVHVNDVIEAIRTRTKIRAFFTIATVRDLMGDLINEETHLTVKPIRWWLDQFRRVWKTEPRTCEGNRKWRHILVIDK